jgi:secreted trypsin-like serine protease
MKFPVRRLLAIGFVLSSFLGAAVAFADETRATPRIIDATLVPEAQFPTVGRIGTVDDPAFCSGTLIAPRFVLLAGHCVNAQSPGSFLPRFSSNRSRSTTARKTRAPRWP